MDGSPRCNNPTPRLRANVFSKLTYWWMNPIFKKGYTRRLEEDDMYNVTRDEDSKYLGDELEREWQKETRRYQDSGKNPCLFKSLFRTFGFSYILYGILLLFEEATIIIQPILLSGLIRYFTADSPVSNADSYMYAGGVGFCAIILAFTHHPYYLGVQMIGIRMKVACSSLIYKKSQRLSSEGRRQTTTGKIVNFLANDVRNFSQLMTMLHFVWIGPCEVIAVLVILWLQIGPPAIAGFLVIFLMAPLLHLIGKLISKYRKTSSEYRDKRIHLVNEFIKAIRVIKLYCWEKPLGDLLRKERRLEVDEQRKLLHIHLVQDTLTFVSKLLFLLPVVVWMMLASIDLRASTVFMAIRIYDHAGLTVLRRMVRAYTLAIQTKVSLSRIQKFLLLDEIFGGTESVTDRNTQEEECYVDFNIKSAKWERDCDRLTLKDVSARVKTGKMLTIIGPVGAGKSSILLTILKELPEVDGEINVSGRVAYASQEPWVFSGTVQQNITFGNEFDRPKYNRILKACALDRDISVMPNGDETLIGDRGVILSGGQKSRVSLARALYTDADIYLLDDPLSAVDSIVGQHIFENVIQGILKGKAIVLVTHQLQFLRFSDEIIDLNEGKMVGKGTYQELSPVIKQYNKSNEQSESHCETHARQDTGSRRQHDRHEEDLPDSEIIRRSKLSLTSISPDFKPEPVQVPLEEERREKTVKATTYSHYFKAGAGLFPIIIMTIAFLATQGSYIFCDWWLSYWTNQEEDKYAAMARDADLSLNGVNKTHVMIPRVDTQFNIAIFSVITGGVFIFGLLRALMFFKVALDASQNLHNSMFDSVLRTRIGFFDANQATGRILNRFSKDIRQLDDSLPKTFFEFLQCALIVLGVIIVAGMAVPWVYIALLPLTVVFVLLRRYYVKTANHIRRLQSTTLSPVSGHVAVTQEGICTIRAFGVQKKMIEKYDYLQNLHTQTTIMSLTSARWFAVRLDLLCALFVNAVSFSCVLTADRLNAGLVGLSITYTMSLMALFQWCVRQSAEVENQMIAVERILEYKKLLPEPTEGSAPPPKWPKTGEITVQGVSLRYSSELPNVLKDLSFTIRDREKVGIVGRTGAGKSSLVTMLFRLVEPTGSIMIDNVNIQEIGVHDLRKSISIILQEPVLFTGPLRKNIDRFGDYEDGEIWNALDEVQLKRKIEELPQGLDTEVSEGGSNFSVGERQLICLARAILRDTKIIVIDEATANVDCSTDEVIQHVIRLKFRGCTVLTIAHRLLTVMDCDRILVLDDGNVVEFDVPFLLLQNTNSLLRKMVAETGEKMASYLFKTAKSAYDRNEPAHADEDQESDDVLFQRSTEENIVLETSQEVDENTSLL
ncbi:ATP-binding cassette sub-family C member 4-like [Mercenaria mercenaria]|uniref:ATP-binding cassette sub-family C member 4-like n=1 Tax=Mercenaria mercenaria TaxID=6596 RepID=UPI00234F8854|nr:ATP-binding cassette sub-family C member 4-like [Mercenaria mercenaria]XP_053394983.1 ATP-binding cassette sub-family C member 4-like [Mercenaria mercenaria]XP_053394984.1 ATP-binding cassette sub-family C member 4-like [Mercenaria mercenaria]